MDSDSAVARRPLIGGALCLDFSNTLSNRHSERLAESLHGYTDLAAWSCHAGSLSAERARVLLEEAARRPVEAREVVARALALREAIYGLFSAIARGEEPNAADLDRLNAELANAFGRARLKRGDAAFVWDWGDDADTSLQAPLGPIARSAADLLTSDKRNRVKECAGYPCSWLFLDTSRNRSRRWCDMRDCGNREKSRRHYQRSRRQASLRS